MRTKLFLAIVLLIGTVGYGQATTQPAEKPIPQVQHVVIVSIDGLRPDCALRADMPALRSLLARGSYSFWARTTAVSITLPSHVSMLTGVTPFTHHIDWNDNRAGPEALKVPTIFENAKAAGYTTAFSASKTKFKLFAKPGAVDDAYWPAGGGMNDDNATTKAVELFTSLKPNVFFFHLGEVDNAGHSIGWGTPQQIAAIERCDGRLGKLLGAIDQAGLTDSTVVILSADHGGAGLTHGKDDPRSRHIPWIAAGPGIAPNVDLTRFRDLTINTEDTFATASWLLGIPIDPAVDGKPIKEILPRK
jgi:predicted AlkP superfamily pyrophosphatase or phosphodiesterase